MRPDVILVLGLAIVTPWAASVGPMPSPVAAVCGVPGKPACPLQAWMREHVAAPLAKRDWRGLAMSLDRLQTLNPQPGAWKHWERLASEGARAARDANETKALQTCTSCHDLYRSQYNELFRQRALP